MLISGAETSKVTLTKLAMSLILMAMQKAINSRNFIHAVKKLVTMEAASEPTLKPGDSTGPALQFNNYSGSFTPVKLPFKFYETILTNYYHFDISSNVNRMW